LFAGGFTFGLSWLLAAETGALFTYISREESGHSNGRDYLYLAIPVAGPLVALSERMPDEFRALMVLTASAQLAGAIMFGFGMVKKDTWVRDEPTGVTWRLAPVAVGSRAPGCGVTGSF
jgi:hypothetical protein